MVAFSARFCPDAFSQWAYISQFVFLLLRIVFTLLQLIFSQVFLTTLSKVVTTDYKADDFVSKSAKSQQGQSTKLYTAIPLQIHLNSEVVAN